jgi:hypothetical protein
MIIGRAFSLSTLALLLAVGCGDDDGATPDSGVTTVDSGAPEEPCQSGTCMEYVFVASTADIGQATAAMPNVAPGFNLDDRVSTPVTGGGSDDPQGCFRADFTSPPPDSEMGVDNQLGPIVTAIGSGFDISGSIQENIADGGLLLLMKITDVDDTTTDGNVGFSLVLGELQAGVEAPMVDAMGRLTGGQTFDIDSRSLGAGMTPLVSGRGRIINGRMRVGPVDIMINFTVSDMPIALAIRDAQVRATFSGTDALETGVIGGSLRISEVAPTLAMAADLDQAIVEAALNGQSDLDPNADGSACASVSVALTFAAVEAIEGMVVTPMD